MVQPRISIIIPNYNHGKFLESAIQSVVTQSYPNRELIIIDGGSTDSSLDIIRRHEDAISYWVSERDKGTFDANNKGLAKISGDYWCILNSDDILMPGALSVVAEFVKSNPDEKWITGGIDMIDEQGSVFHELIPQEPVPIEGFTFLQGCWISHPSTFIHKDVIREVGVFERWNAMDYAYWLRMESHGFRPSIIHRKLAGLRLHRSAKSYDNLALYTESVKVVKAFCHQHLLDERPAVKAKLKDYDILLARTEITIHLVQGRKVKAISLLMAHIMSVPATIIERWFFGTLKRIVFGVKPGDPIRVHIGSDNGTATWHEV